MSDDTRFVDELQPVYEALEKASEEARTEREEYAIETLASVLEYARLVGLQREFPTPNQKLLAEVGGETYDKPDDPGSLREFLAETDEFDAVLNRFEQGCDSDE